MKLYMSATYGGLITLGDLWKFAQRAEMYTLNETQRNSRYADTSHTLSFNGYGSDTTHSARRANDRGQGASMGLYAATWDQWGVLLSSLFFHDPLMKVGGHKRPYYDGADDFHFQTGGRFKRVFTYADLIEADRRAGVPAHRDHRFRFDPSCGDFTTHVSRCTKGAREGRQCKAVMVRG